MSPRPPFWQEKADRMLGKTVLVGKTVQVDGREPERAQYHGVIETADASRGVAIRRADSGALEWLPPDLRAFHPARRGVYTLAGTGEQVCDPDFISTWDYTPPNR